jgi:hypothetical protein
MSLFIVENNIAKPNMETLLITPYKEMWERDESKGKEIAIKEYTFIELMASKKHSNPYAGLSDNERFERLKLMLFTPEWVMDKLIEQGLSLYVEFQQEASPTYSYYLSVLTATEKMKQFFNEFDMTEKNERTGLPVYKPSDITRALNDTDKVLQNIHNMKEKVEQELFETTKTKSNKTINPFEK